MDKPKNNCTDYFVGVIRELLILRKNINVHCSKQCAPEKELGLRRPTQRSNLGYYIAKNYEMYRPTGQDTMGRACGYNGETRNAYKVWSGKLLKNVHLGD
jgi:hypothetical protein